MKYLTAILGLALCVASCTNTKSADSTTEETKESPKIEGTWDLTEYVANDSTVKVQSNDSTEYAITFTSADSTFTMSTGCNNIAGKYALAGDSIKFDNMMSTKMMCPDMSVEDAMSGILPAVTTVSVDNDTVLSLNANDKALATFVKK